MFGSAMNASLSPKLCRFSSRARVTTERYAHTGPRLQRNHAGRSPGLFAICRYASLNVCNDSGDVRWRQFSHEELIARELPQMKGFSLSRPELPGISRTRSKRELTLPIPAIWRSPNSKAVSQRGRNRVSAIPIPQRRTHHSAPALFFFSKILESTSASENRGGSRAA